MRLYVIPAGTLRIDKGAVFTPGIDDGVLIEIPVPVYLIRTDNYENVLVDTGLHPAHIDDPSHSFGLENADEVLARMQPEDRLERRLAEVGLSGSRTSPTSSTPTCTPITAAAAASQCLRFRTPLQRIKTC